MSDRLRAALLIFGLAVFALPACTAVVWADLLPTSETLTTRPTTAVVSPANEPNGPWLALALPADAAPVVAADLGGAPLAEGSWLVVTPPTPAVAAKQFGTVPPAAFTRWCNRVRDGVGATTLAITLPATTATAAAPATPQIGTLSLVTVMDNSPPPIEGLIEYRIVAKAPDGAPLPPTATLSIQRTMQRPMTRPEKCKLSARTLLADAFVLFVVL